jgi:hypothetical protein
MRAESGEHDVSAVPCRAPERPKKRRFPALMERPADAACADTDVFPCDRR